MAAFRRRHVAGVDVDRQIDLEDRLIIVEPWRRTDRVVAEIAGWRMK